MTSPGSPIPVGEATTPAALGAHSSWREMLNRYGPYALLAGALLIHGLFWLSIFKGNLNFLFNDAVHRRGQGADFFALYLAGTRALTGGSIYDPTGWQEVVPYLFPYRYVPLPAYTLGPVLAQFAPFQAYHLWILAIELMLLLNLWLTWRLASSPAQFALVAAGWLAFTPFYMELFMGQFSFVMVTLFYVMGYALLRWEINDGDPPVPMRRWLFGGAWSLSLVWKSNSALLAPLVVRLRAWPTLLAGAAVLLLTMLPYFQRFPQDWETFAQNFQAPTFLGSHAGNLGLHALLLAVLRPVEALNHPLPRLAPELPSGVLLVQLTVGLIALISLWATFTPVTGTLRRLFARNGSEAEKPDRFDPVVGLALWVIVYFLVYRDVWEHHYVMLLPALALLWLKGDFPRWPVLLAWLFVAAPSLLWVIDRPGPQDPEWFWPYWQSVVYHSTKVVPVLILWAVVVVWLVAKARSKDP